VKPILKVLCAFPVVFTLSCNSGSGSGNASTAPTSNNFDGTEPAVTDLYSQEQLDALVALGLTVHLGDTPPNIEGTFLASPALLQSSSVGGDESLIGAQFADALMTFSNQNNESLTVDLLLDEVSIDSQSVGEGSFISGSGSNFTVYFVTETELNNAFADTTVTISGSMTLNGIENAQLALFMLDNRGNLTGEFIENNTGRLLIDGDGFSERQTAARRAISVTPSANPIPLFQR